MVSDRQKENSHKVMSCLPQVVTHQVAHKGNKTVIHADRQTRFFYKIGACVHLAVVVSVGSVSVRLQYHLF